MEDRRTFVSLRETQAVATEQSDECSYFASHQINLLDLDASSHKVELVNLRTTTDSIDFQSLTHEAASPSSSLSGGVALAEDVEDGDSNQTSLIEATARIENAPGKVGGRFTSAAIKTLRIWFDNHERHPYPAPEDFESLQRQTGLSKQQLSNWFANTRRRRKSHHSKSSSSHNPDSASGPLDLPLRRPTPMPFEHMSPMQRWENSPPEHEPALVSDISRAVAASSRRLGPHASRSRSSDRSSGNGSSNSSVITSHSSRGSKSNASAYSYDSNRSTGLPEPTKRDVVRRRRRAITKIQKGRRPNLRQPRGIYQCTFCADTFKTKYDWQRHEKSLHLSLEEWVCSPRGAAEINPDKGMICVFCDAVDPDQAHLDSHHQAACSDRPIEERTFYRKDHLRQHLKLVHRTKQMTRWMDKWKVTSDEVRSRCGFCGINLETWSQRGDHLADHFKNGSTIADWQGDWGFESSIAKMLDNAMPPYLIQFEQNAPLPFCAGIGPADSPASAYELLKLEIEYYVRNYFESYENLPSDENVAYEGCSIIFGAEILSPDSPATANSWLRDLFMASTEVAERARMRPMNQLAKLRMSQLKINGKADIFEDCELESQLCRFIGMHAALGLTVSDEDLQKEACAILSRVESCSTNPSRRFVGFLVRKIWESTAWLCPIRLRGELLSFDAASQGHVSSSTSQNDQMDLFYGELADLGQLSGEAGRLLRSRGVANIESEAGMFDLPAPATFSCPAGPSSYSDQPTDNLSTAFKDSYMRMEMAKTLFVGSGLSLHGGDRPRGVWAMPFFLNDCNRYRRLSRELSRFVASTMSPNNPNMHVPSDEELRHQARWMLYDDDDPWNQTPADIPEWLRDFKQDVGLL
ncbi:Homeobox protein 4-like protein 3 [Colletotrichum chlorophyti]|uniref:Homeobox protein 4-like protein 3 n=1 Tax=Colletotrichum chlorophyti TaxID=708187 RepID=A0A1Q8RPW9_9PEZI|nr:Homeobox protein 4-like protein 3 [Colletotrichum chlorophyti]